MCESIAFFIMDLKLPLVLVDPESAEPAASRKFFQKFSRSFRKFFASFRKFFEVFGIAGTCPDLFGYVQMGLDASGCIRKHSDSCGKFLENRSKN